MQCEMPIMNSLIYDCRISEQELHRHWLPDPSQTGQPILDVSPKGSKALLRQGKQGLSV